VGNSKIISQSKKLGLTELPRYPNVNSYTLILFIQTPKLVGGIPTTLKNTSNTAQGGGGSFKNRKPIGELGCCE